MNPINDVCACLNLFYGLFIGFCAFVRERVIPELLAGLFDFRFPYPFIRCVVTCTRINKKRRMHAKILEQWQSILYLTAHAVVKL